MQGWWRARSSLRPTNKLSGVSAKGARGGTFGDMGVFSFQMNKDMTSVEGGGVVTNDSRLYHRAIACHDLGYARL
jgi:8-amino-3,8-dideoxy-alpha-D-manno-octulosonate transaminase